MKKLNYIFWLTSLIFIFSGYFSLSFASSSPQRETINILTWWEYLDYPQIINAAEKECGVRISFDEYFSNDEFLRRWEEQKESYDVIIFSDTIYKGIKDKIPHYNYSTLSKQSILYNPTIKSHYDNAKYPHNVVYFLHSLTGFLWNPKNILLSSNDSIISIFNKAKQKYVVFIDDPVEANKLIEASLNDSHQHSPSNDVLSISNFKKMIQESRVYITNTYSQIYNKPDFAFSFSWSGEMAINQMKSNKGYKFLIHPKLSYISTDLIAHTSNKKGALCVAKFLTSKVTMAVFQRKDFYFSPYTDYSGIQNPIFKDIYKNFVISLPTLNWLDSCNEKNFQIINTKWQLIKLSLNNRNWGA